MGRLAVWVTGALQANEEGPGWALLTARRLPRAAFTRPMPSSSRAW